MIPLLVGCLLWGLGYSPRSAGTSSGFGSDQLIPTRERNGIEAAIRIVSSGFFLLAIVAQLPTVELGFLTAPQLHLLALASAAWGLQMLLRPSIPMDSTAISTALWSFAGYLPYFLTGNILDLPLETLLWQAGAVGGLIAYGLFRDIRREISR
jgi:hypothetical protein